MPSIPRTWISSSSGAPRAPVTYDFLLGVPNTRLPTLGVNLHSVLLDVSAACDVAKASVSLTIDLFDGLAGPGWSTAFYAQGTYDDDRINLTLDGAPTLQSGSETIAGLFAGASVTISLEIGFDIITLWYPTISCHHWHCHTNWHPVWLNVSIPAEFTIDIIELILSLISGDDEGGADEGEAGSGEAKWQDLGSFDLRDRSESIHSEGTAELDLEWTKLINLAGREEFKTVRDFLEKFGGEIEVGPIIGFSIQPNISIDTIHTDGKDACGDQGLQHFLMHRFSSGTGWFAQGL